MLARLDQRHRHALAAGAPGPSDAMDVRLGVGRDVEVDDVADVVDVEAARGDVRRDEHVQGAVTEAAHDPVARLLGEAAVQGGGIVPAAAERLGEVVDLAAGPGEDEGRRRVLDVEDAAQGRELVRAPHDIGDLADPRRAVGVAALRVDADPRGVAQVALGDLADDRGDVAEKRTVWRSAGVALRIVSRSSAKPMSSISSASSRMTVRTPSRSRLLRVRWSTARPGVATTTSTPRRRPRSCWWIGWPP